MPRQEDLTFIKTMSNLELSPVFLRELRKGVEAGKKKKALAANASALERQSGVGSEALTSRGSPQIPVNNRKADQLSNSDGPSKPPQPSPCARPSVWNGPEAQDSTGELAAESSRQHGRTDGGLAYAAVVAGRACTQ